MKVIEIGRSNDVLVKIESGDTLSAVSQRLTGTPDNFDQLALVSRSNWRPKKPFRASLIYPDDVFTVPRHLMLPVVAIDHVL